MLCTAIVDVHRELLRNLQQWHSLFEAREVPDVLVANDLVEHSLWDVQRFYAARTTLPDRQALSVQFCLYENMKEKDAAVRMGIKPSNPVSIYATIGLTSLLNLVIADDLPGYTIVDSAHDGLLARMEEIKQQRIREAEEAAEREREEAEAAEAEREMELVSG